MKVGYQPPKGGLVRGVLLATEQSGNETATVALGIAASFSGTGGSEVKRGPRFAPAGAGAAPAETPAAEKTTALAPGAAGICHPGRIDPEFDALRVPGAVDQSHWLVEQAKKHPAAVRTKGWCSRRAYQFHGPASRPCF